MLFPSGDRVRTPNSRRRELGNWVMQRAVVCGVLAIGLLTLGFGEPGSASHRASCVAAADAPVGTIEVTSHRGVSCARSLAVARAWHKAHPPGTEPTDRRVRGFRVRFSQALGEYVAHRREATFRWKVYAQQ